MKIEVLYPEIANLFGDMGNIRYIQDSVSDCEIINTGLKERPRFLDSQDIDLVYMGTLSENSQVIAMDHMAPILEEVKSSIESGTRFLFTGNAFEIFAKEIIDLDDEPYEDAPARFNPESKITTCLGLFDITIKRTIMHRFNSLYLGKYQDIEIVGFKSLFTYAEMNEDLPPLFETVKGPGMDRTLSGEGIHYKNFMATYLTGPIMPLNPKFMIKLLNEIGVNDVNPPYMEAAMEAYNQRLNEFKRDGLNYNY